MLAKRFSRLRTRGHLTEFWDASLSAIKFAGLALLLAISGVAQAGESSAVETVSRLYRDFAWEAVMDDSHGIFLADQPKPVLERYFTSKLAAALVADSECKTRTREICGLDFVPLWGSQDVGAEDLSITQEISTSQVRVEYTTPSSVPGELTKVILRFRMVHTKSGWRVADIIYSSGTSLTKVLDADQNE